MKIEALLCSAAVEKKPLWLDDFGTKKGFQ